MNKGHHKKALLAVICASFSLGLTGCNQGKAEVEIPDATVNFVNSQSCIDAGYEAKGCETGYRVAMAQYFNEAPKYGLQIECEKDWGKTNCQQLIKNKDIIFMPTMAGYSLSSSVEERNQNFEEIFHRSENIWSAPFYYTTNGASVYVEKEEEKNNATFVYGSKSSDPNKRPSMNFVNIWFNSNQFEPEEAGLFS